MGTVLLSVRVNTPQWTLYTPDGETHEIDGYFHRNIEVTGDWMTGETLDVTITAPGYQDFEFAIAWLPGATFPYVIDMTASYTESGTDWIDNFLSDIEDMWVIGDLVSAIKQPFTHLNDWINDIGQPLDNIASDVGQSVDGWVNDINSAIGDVAGTLGNIGNAVANADDMADDTATWIEDKLTSIIEGIW